MLYFACTSKKAAVRTLTTASRLGYKAHITKCHGVNYHYEPLDVDYADLPKKQNRGYYWRVDVSYSLELTEFDIDTLNRYRIDDVGALPTFPDLSRTFKGSHSAWINALRLAESLGLKVCITNVLFTKKNQYWDHVLEWNCKIDPFRFNYNESLALKNIGFRPQDLDPLERCHLYGLLGQADSISWLFCRPSRYEEQTGADYNDFNVDLEIVINVQELPNGSPAFYETTRENLVESIYDTSNPKRMVDTALQTVFELGELYPDLYPNAATYLANSSSYGGPRRLFFRDCITNDSHITCEEGLEHYDGRIVLTFRNLSIYALNPLLEHDISSHRRDTDVTIYLADEL
jgi:hypothetical protein